jgi:hypothetical protein
MKSRALRYAWIAGFAVLLPAAVAVEVLGGGHARTGWGQGLVPALGGHLLRCALAAFFFLSAWALGDLLLHEKPARYGSPRNTPVFFATVAGMAILAGALFYMAVLDLWTPPAFRIFFLAQCALIAWWGTLRLTMRNEESPRRLGVLARCPECGIGLALLALYLAPSLLTALAPPHRGWDDLVYHLALPAAYLRGGGFAPMPENFFAQQPGATELLYAWGLALGDDVVAVLLHFGLGGVACLGLWELGRRLGFGGAACLAPFLFVCHYMVGEEFGWAYHDVAMAAYLLAAAWGLLAWARGRCTRRELIAAALAAGMVCGSKYTGAGYVLGLLLGAVAVYVLRRRRGYSVFKPSAAAARLVVFTMIGILALSSWIAKNWIYTGNPVWPMMPEVWDGEAWCPVLTYRLVAWQLHGYGFGRGVLDWFLLPGRVFFTGDALSSRFGGPLASLPLVAALAGWLFLSRPRVMIGLAFAGFALLFGVWALGSQQSRFLIPVLPLLALAGAPAAGCVVGKIACLAGWRPGEMKRKRSRSARPLPDSVMEDGRSGSCQTEAHPAARRWFRAARWVLCILLFAAWVGNLGGTLRPRWRAVSSNFAMLAGRESWEVFLSARVRSFDCFRYLRGLSSAEQGRKVLMLFEPMGYYADFPYEFDVLDASRFLELARESATASEFAACLNRRGIVHVIVNHEIMKYYLLMLKKPPGYNPYGDEKLLEGAREGLRIVLEFLDGHCEEIHRANESSVYRILHDSRRE